MHPITNLASNTNQYFTYTLPEGLIPGPGKSFLQCFFDFPHWIDWRKRSSSVMWAVLLKERTWPKSILFPYFIINKTSVSCQHTHNRAVAGLYYNPDETKTILRHHFLKTCPRPANRAWLGSSPWPWGFKTETSFGCNCSPRTVGRGLAGCCTHLALVCSGSGILFWLGHLVLVLTFDLRNFYFITRRRMQQK